MVDISNYNLNKPHFDWISFTVFDIDVDNVCLRLGFAISDMIPLLKTLNFYDKCYKIKDTDIILCSKSDNNNSGKGDMGVNVQIPASSLGLLFDNFSVDEDISERDVMRHLVDFVKSHNGRFSRLDVCIDVSLECRHASFTPYQLFNKRDRQVSKFRNITLNGSPEHGCTVYFGKRGSSNTLLRIYDKAKEQGDFDNLVTRVEFELKREEAHFFLDNYFEYGMNVSFRDLVKRKIRFDNYEIWTKFEELLDKVSRSTEILRNDMPVLYPRKVLDCVQSLTRMFFQYNKPINNFFAQYSPQVLLDFMERCSHYDIDCDVYRFSKRDLFEFVSQLE